MEREKKTDSKEVMDEGTLRGVLYIYMMREEVHLTLKEKKMRGRFLRFGVRDLSFHNGEKGTIKKRKEIFRYIKQRLR